MTDGLPSADKPYYSTQPVPGFDPHFDTHDLSVLQLAGSKRWRIGRQPHPEARQVVKSRPEDAPNHWDRDFLLRQSATMFLPRGTWHMAETAEAPSLHMTVSYRYDNVHDYLVWLAKNAYRCDALRKRLRTFTSQSDDINGALTVTLANALREMSKLDFSPQAMEQSKILPSKSSDHPANEKYPSLL
ncbi:JmjC domain-containing protein [Rhodovulum sulfidophilum]|uniref:JmjC domain-containing protein n=1 Tax=Rhodovulum sulfidophilum TaxID=35806 RepID=A0ABS1RYL6_RHOSU|nr:cupin domain-containing protein [Rhodovulum sulfidophilum]MBL3610582.1 hypothetical protein [Rhodovulum sulfidophilum]MCE8456629.1 cupin domain-containing protein [Rhodovulum sulfidophilum]